jgi:hypothetical protein
VEMARLRALEGGVDALFSWGANQPDDDVFSLSDTLEDAVKSLQPSVEMLVVSFRLLLLCVRFAEAFRDDAVTKNEVGAGARFRLPLGVWADFVKAHEQQSLTDFLHKVLARFIISQHLGVAASRSSDEKSRMRMSIEDGGLTSLLPNARKVLQPRRTADRLASALALMADCGLVREIAPTVKSGSPAYVVV